MKLRCAVLDDYQQVAQSMADWSVISDRVELQFYEGHFTSLEETVEELQDYDIIVIMRERTPFRRELLSQLPKLKLLVTTGMRNASVDLGYAAEQGITVCGTASLIQPPTELTWALILGLTKQLIPEHRALHDGGPWQSTLSADLYGRTLGLLGLGKIGSHMAVIAQAFGMNVIAWSENLTDERAQALGVIRAASKEELLEQSDIVSIHLVLSERTRHLIGEPELQRMKKTAYLINTSRAAIVDQAALIHALEQDRIAGAGLDVFEIEPLPKDHPYRRLPNVLATPHIGYVTEGNYRTYFTEAVADIQAYLQGAPIRQLNL